MSDEKEQVYNSELVYNDKYIKIKTKTYDNRA